MGKKKVSQELPAEAKARAEEFWAQVPADPEGALAVLEAEAKSDPELAAAFLAGLADRPSPEAGWLVVEAGQSMPSKPVRKAAKRAAYLLKSKGVSLPEAQKGRAIFRPAETPSPFGFITGYYPDGSQVFYLALTMKGAESICGAALAHFHEGFKILNLAPMGPGKLNKLIEETGIDFPWSPVRIDGPEMIWLLASLIDLSRDQVVQGAEDLSFLRNWLAGQEAPPESAPIYQQLGMDPNGQPEPGSLGRLEELLYEPPCMFWRPELETWEKVSKRIEDEIATGLVLSQLQAEERLERHLASALPELFPSETWPNWRRRLEETALFAARSGREDDGRVFLSAAQAIGQEEHPLFLALMRRAWQESHAETDQDTDQDYEIDGASVVGPEGELVQSTEPSGLILPPSLKGDNRES